jgi:hypothetical protein
MVVTVGLEPLPFSLSSIGVVTVAQLEKLGFAATDKMGLNFYLAKTFLVVY